MYLLWRERSMVCTFYDVNVSWRVLCKGLVFCTGVLSYVLESCLMCRGLVLCAGAKSYVQGAKSYVQGSESYVQGSKSSNSVFLWRERSMA